MQTKETQPVIVGADQLSEEDLARIFPFFGVLLSYRYSFSGLPTLSLEMLTQETCGVNCQYLVYEMLGWMFDVDVPPTYLSKELYEIGEDDPNFVKIDLEEKFQPGDVLLFNNALKNSNLFDARYLHPVLVIGLDNEGRPLCLHMLSFEDKSRHAVEIWKMQEFLDSRFHNQLMGVRRPRALDNSD